MTSDQFQRTQLLFGSQGLMRLRAAHIAVVGCGAVGSFAAEALARVGIGHITLIDGDRVESSNINRQLCALHSTLGKNKAHILSDRIHDICPETKVIAHTTFLKEDNIDKLLLPKPDFVIDAIDQVTDKVDLILWLQMNHIPFISSMGAAMRTDFKRIQIAPLSKTTVCPLAAKIRHKLRQKGGDLSFPCVFSDEPPKGNSDRGRQMASLITITGTFGLIAADKAIRFICQETE